MFPSGVARCATLDGALDSQASLAKDYTWGDLAIGGIQVKGLVLFPDSSYRLEEVPEPRLGENIFAPDDVLIEVELCGICGSDVHHLGDKSGLAGPPKPVVTGHEITGTVRGVGSGVTRFAAGDSVVCEIVTFYCGHCVNCRAGLHNICINTPPMHGRAHYITGGGFAPLVVWPERHVHQLPDSISFKEAVLLELCTPWLNASRYGPGSQYSFSARAHGA